MASLIEILDKISLIEIQARHVFYVTLIGVSLPFALFLLTVLMD
jgi:hypothetical protein